MNCSLYNETPKNKKLTGKRPFSGKEPMTPSLHYPEEEENIK